MTKSMTKVLELEGYEICYDRISYVMHKPGDKKGKRNCYYGRLEHALKALMDKIIPTQIANEANYKPTLENLIIKIRAVKEMLKKEMRIPELSTTEIENIERQVKDEWEKSRSRITQD